MITTMQGYEELIERLNRSVEAGDIGSITGSVKADLEDLLGRRALQLPQRFRVPRVDTYARRLLYRDPAGRYSAIVMTWGPGQKTALHDHGGLWCVEGVVEGQVVVTQFDVRPDGSGRFLVKQLGTLQAGIGSAGYLIPPTDHHVLGNASGDEVSITLHVYGGDLDDCRIFLPSIDGRYEESMRALSFHD
jgi:predicted metal-dependent enzyme (double-stranded beta helix superfamily)